MTANRSSSIFDSPFQQEPEFAVESINYKLQELLARGELPA